MKKLLGLSILAATLLLAACGQLGINGQVVPPTAPASSTPTRPAPTAAPTTAAAQCPTPAQGQALYVSRENGFCFLYPAAFSAQPDFLRPAQAVDVSGPGITQGQDRAVLHLTVASNGPAYGLDSQGYAEKWRKVYHVDPNVTVQPLELNGQPAELMDNLPGGMFNQREALVVANGFKYQVTLTPTPDQVPQLADQAGQAWNLMKQSLKLFPPANPQPVARPDEVCPKAGADTKLWVDEAQGFCVLYPADFALTADVPVAIVGGPVLTDTQSWGKVRTSLTLATYDQPPSQAQTPAPPAVNVDPTTVQTTTIGGGQAVIYDFLGAPWRQRTADILAHGSRYTMVGPWDAQALPQGEADARRLWDTVTKSVVFFEKWH